MKKTIAFIITLLVSTAAFSQKFSVGTELGIISSINTDYKIKDLKNRRNTIYGGLNLNYQFNQRLSITTGLHYLQQGYSHSTCYIFADGVKNKLTGKLNYLAVPVTANIRFLNSQKLITTFGLLGAYNIKAVQEHPESIGGCELYYSPDLTDGTKKYQISGIIGLGYKFFETDKIAFTSFIKYYHGLTNTFTNPYKGFNLNIDRRSSSALLTFTFNYML